MQGEPQVAQAAQVSQKKSSALQLWAQHWQPSVTPVQGQGLLEGSLVQEPGAARCPDALMMCLAWLRCCPRVFVGALQSWVCASL